MGPAGVGHTVWQGQGAAKGSCVCQTGCGHDPELPVGLHSFSTAFPTALHSFPAAHPTGKSPAGASGMQRHKSQICCSSCHPSPPNSLGDQVHPLKHLVPEDSFTAVSQAVLACEVLFLLIRLLATWYARNFTFSTLFLSAFELLYLFKMKARCYINKRTAFPKGKHSSGQRQTL